MSNDATGHGVHHDPHGLQRFLDEQQLDYPLALGELRAGAKKSHWMWYIFPQVRGLGTSQKAVRFGIRSLDEARAYLAHPVLGPRLLECCAALLAIDGQSALEILGPPDDMKLRSSAPSSRWFRRLDPSFMACWTSSSGAAPIRQFSTLLVRGDSCSSPPVARLQAAFA